MNKDANQQAITIYPDRMKLFRSLVFPLAFEGLLVVPVVTYRRSSNLAAKFISFVAGGLLFLWGILYLPSLSRLLFPKPVVTIDDNGISYNPSRVGFVKFNATIAWEEVAALYTGRLTMQRNKSIVAHRFLCILPRDGESFWTRYNLFSKLVTAVLMAKMDLPPIIIPESFLPLTVDELLTRIGSQYRDEIQAHAIELREEFEVSVPS